MPTDPRITAELRSMFREGSTPSRLIKHLLDHHGREGFFSLLQTYFREAFAVPLVRASNRPEDYGGSDLRFAHLNVHLLHAMIQHRAEWDNAYCEGDRPVCWLDSLVAAEESELIERANPAALPEFANCWEALGQEAQKYIKRIMGNANALYERVRILATLAEQLQQRVAELEKQLAERDVHELGNAPV